MCLWNIKKQILYYPSTLGNDLYLNELKGLHEGMVGLTASTEEKLVREKEQNMFHFTRSHQNFHWTVWPQDSLCFFLLRKHYQQRTKTPATDRQTDTEMLWPWASIRWRNLVRENTIWVMESSVATFSVLYRTSHIVDVKYSTIVLWKPCINVSAVQKCACSARFLLFFITDCKIVRSSYDF